MSAATIRAPRLLTMVLLVLAVAIGTAAVAGASRAGPSPPGRGDHKVVLVPPRAEPSARDRSALQTPSRLAAAVEPAAVTPGIAAPVDLKVLVVSADGNEYNLPAIQGALQRLGVPFDTFVAVGHTLTADLLASGGKGKYQGIILTTGNLVSETTNWYSAFDDTEWQTLWAYETQYGVRQVTAYNAPFGYPDDYGLTLDPTTPSVSTICPPPGPCPTYEATLTVAGRQVFADLNPATPIAFSSVWIYQATPRTLAAGEGTITPLLTAPNPNGSTPYAIASVRTYPDGRQNLAITADGADWMIHQKLLSYGIVNWVTRGLFLGERHVNLDIQVDDLLLDDDMWDVAANSDQTGLSYRLSGADLTATRQWQQTLRGQSPLLQRVTLEHAYNGEGSTGIYPDDTLTPSLKSNQASFNWVNHGWEHLDLDTADYATARAEIQQNLDAAKKRELNLANFSREAYVQADITGLTNPAFHQAAADLGIKYLISDTSRPGGDNPSPNAGRPSPYQPSILIVPRRPSNLFFNVTTPEQWVDEYNCYYGPTGTCAGGAWRYWDHDLTYPEILDVESGYLLGYLLNWDLDPWMFHQANLRFYETGKSVLTDLLDATFAKYTARYSLPVRNLSEAQVGDLMAQRMKWDAAQPNVTATLTPCTRGSAQITLTSTTAAVVPVTGVSVGKAEVYAGQPISWLTLSPGSPRTVKVGC